MAGEWGQELPGLQGSQDSLNITVLMGGPSNERAISLISGEAIACALARKGHNVRRADINPSRTAALDADGIDLVFIAMHGEFGESGQLQKLCEDRSLTYTGSGPTASALAMDKVRSKETFRWAGLNTPDWAIIGRGSTCEQIAEAVAFTSLPVVIKPIGGGSSLDIIIARTSAQRKEAIDDVLEKYPVAMVEEYVAGREFTVGILSGQVLPIMEIVPAGKFYDYRSKYTDCGTQYVFDHGLCEDVQKRIYAESVTAFEVLGCRDFGRVDFMLGEDGVPQILEMNTIPGFTSHSLLPMAAEQAGVPFDELVDAIAGMAIAAADQR